MVPVPRRTMFEFRVIPAIELSEADRATWRGIQRADTRFSSPFFRPELMESLARLRDDIQVAVLYDDDEAVGFLPIEVCGDVGKPAGYPLSSYHGVVTTCEGWTAEAILPAAGIHQLRFDHWIPAQAEVQSSISVRRPSALLDLSDGFAGYINAKKRAGSKVFSDSSRRFRKLSREVAPVTCVQSRSPKSIERLVEWNSTQCERTGVANLFDFQWTVDLLRDLATRANDDFGGIVWELYVGDKPIAVNYVLRSAHVGHGWFMAFDWEYRGYSPGMILMHEMLRELADLGVTQLDLGTGCCKYKERLMTHTADLGEGVVDSRFVTRAAWSNWLKTRDWVRKSKFRSSAHRVDRWLTNTRRIFGGKA